MSRQHHLPATYTGLACAAGTLLLLSACQTGMSEDGMSEKDMMEMHEKHMTDEDHLRHMEQMGDRQDMMEMHEKHMTDEDHRQHMDKMADKQQMMDGKQGEMTALQGEWLVMNLPESMMQDLEMPATTALTIHFKDDGYVAGNSACNSYRADYQNDSTRYKDAIEGNLRLGMVASTRKACIPVLMTIEQGFLNLLRNVEHYRINADNELTLTTADGEKIVASRKS